jgi:hypothetical protein
MTNHTVDVSVQKAAKVAGLMYVLIIVLGVLKVNFLESTPIMSGNDAATNNIIANELLFRVGVVIEIILFVLVILLSVLLYIILKNVNKDLALMALFLRFGEAIIGGVITVISGVVPLLLLNEQAAFETEQLHALVGSFLNVRMAGLDVVLIFVGLGGTIFCYLFFKSKYVPRPLATWGIVTYVSMLILALISILIPNHPEMIEIVLYSFGGLFELTFGFWLLVKGVNAQQRDNQMPASSI